jgi:hypothetical protein
MGIKIWREEMAETQEDKPEEKRSLGGVKGWLLFFCISLTILTPLFITYRLYNNWEEFRPVFFYFKLFKTKCIIDTVLGIGMMIFSIYTGIVLWTKQKNAVKTGKIFLVTALIYQIIISVLPFVTAVIVMWFSHIYVAYLFGLMVGSIPQGILYFAIWNSYLSESRRVKATYHS